MFFVMINASEGREFNPDKIEVGYYVAENIEYNGCGSVTWEVKFVAFPSSEELGGVDEIKDQKSSSQPERVEAPTPKRVKRTLMFRLRSFFSARHSKHA